MQTNTTEALRILNALRSGVVPDADIDLFRIGREKELKEIERCLDFAAEGNGFVKFVSGEYGSGKSFLLNAAKQLAARKKFAVSGIQLSKGFYLNNPEHFYYHIMHNLSTGYSGFYSASFESIFDIWLDKLKKYDSKDAAAAEINNAISAMGKYNSSFARAFLTFIKARISSDAELSNAAASWIKGEKNIPAALKAKFDVKGDVDRQNSMDFLKAFIKLLTLSGCSGLLILADELELAANARSDIRRGCYENLRYIIDGCGSNDFSNCMFLFAGTCEVFEDEERGIKTYQALYQRLGGSVENAGYFPGSGRGVIMKLEKLSLDDLQSLTDKIIHLHGHAYGWKPKISSEAVRNWTLLTLGNPRGSVSLPNTRKFIVKLVEILDIMEQNPGCSIFGSELKIVTRNGVSTFVNTLQKVEAE